MSEQAKTPTPIEQIDENSAEHDSNNDDTPKVNANETKKPSQLKVTKKAVSQTNMPVGAAGKKLQKLGRMTSMVV